MSFKVVAVVVLGSVAEIFHVEAFKPKGCKFFEGAGNGKFAPGTVPGTVEEALLQPGAGCSLGRSGRGDHPKAAIYVPVPGGGTIALISSAVADEPVGTDDRAGSARDHWRPGPGRLASSSSMRRSQA